MTRAPTWLSRISAPTLIVALIAADSIGQVTSPPLAPKPSPRFQALRRAIDDLQATFGEEYPDGDAFRSRLEEIEKGHQTTGKDSSDAFRKLEREALLANPLLDDKVLVVRRKASHPVKDIAIPAPHETNSNLPRLGYDNELAVLDPRHPERGLTTLFRPDDGGYVGEVDLNWDGRRLLFTRSGTTNWTIWEIQLDGSGLRQVSRMPDDVDCFEPCYLPDGRIVVATTASYQSVPCWHGKMPAAHLYVMDRDGGQVRQLCFDQDIDTSAVVLNSGQVLFSRWEYEGTGHIFRRPLMAMNPDGTGQRSVYGSNTWFPNSLFHARPLPGKTAGLVCIASGYHGVPRMGQLVLVDPRQGWQGTDGLVLRISGRGEPIREVIRDAAVDDDWPKFLHPYPLGDKSFLVSMWDRPGGHWTICLADVFDHVIPLYGKPGEALLEPIAIRPRPRPPSIPDRIDPTRTDAFVYLHNVYAGAGLRRVPPGTIKSLRVLSYHYGYRNLAGPDSVGHGGPWDVMRIVGTVPVEKDGSASFRVPSQTPLAVQPLDSEGKAVQLMRSWFTAMPGETLSCVGCHEGPSESSRLTLASAAMCAPRDIDPWYGPPRGFDFEREVQPVLNVHCVTCHDGNRASPDLRGKAEGGPERTWPIGFPDRLHPEMKAKTGGRLSYSPAYDALIPYVRRVGIEDDVSLLVPGEYHADTSPLVQVLRAGHHGVRLDQEGWDRLVTWIDLNAPCHGTWGEVFPIPEQAHQRRRALQSLYGGPEQDPEAIPPAPGQGYEARSGPHRDAAIENPEAPSRNRFGPDRRIEPFEPRVARIDLGGGVALKLVRIPAAVTLTPEPTAMPIERAFWMSTCEVTNDQFRRFDPDHDPTYYCKRLPRPDGQGLPLNEPDQPAVRVAWTEARDFCAWLTARSGLTVALPTEAQWMHAAAAGRPSGWAREVAGTEAFLRANLADRTFAHGVMTPHPGTHPADVTQHSGGVPHLVLEGAALADSSIDDRQSVTAAVGSFLPNAWGLFDLVGNAAEWTATPDGEGRRIVRGGSFFDPPRRVASGGDRISYPEWQKVFNVGFRVVCEDAPELQAEQ